MIRVTRKGFRLIHLQNEPWQYMIGKSHVVAYSPSGQKLLAGHDVILGMSWEDIYRTRYKNRGVNHRANISPQEIKDWLLKQGN